MEYSKRKIDSSIKLKLLEPIINQKTKVLVECHCGIQYKISPQCFFRKNKVIQCRECESKNRIKAYATIGGLRQHPAYPSLDNMKQRCYNKNDPKYKYYGAKGVSICDEWLNSYESFFKFVDETGYKKGLTIDRIDVNKGYSPDNCRWIKQSKQQENRHIQKNNTSGECGVSFQKNISKWFSYIWLKGKRINCGYYKTIEQAKNARDKKLKELNLNYTRINYE